MKVTVVPRQSNVHLVVVNVMFQIFLFCCGLAVGVILMATVNVFPQQLYPMEPPKPMQLQSAAVAETKESRAGIHEAPMIAVANHGMNDEELLWRASMVPRLRRYPFKRVAKIAFMFLTKGAVDLAPLWERFFRGHEGLFSVYVHSSPYYNDTEPLTPSFQGRKIPSKMVSWGDVNMVEAERRLLANALLDISNERFVLLSESCIPLFNFSTVYSYLMNSTQSHVESYDLEGAVGRGRYRPLMSPTISLSDWRKGAQWFEVDRALAVEIVSDDKYFPVFQRYCKGSCYADEHYLPTMVTKLFSSKNSNRTLTWVDWSRGGPHPSRFVRSDVTVEFLEKLRRGSTCVNNGNITTICHLFARKFLPNTLDRLLRFAPKIMHFHC